MNDISGWWIIITLIAAIYNFAWGFIYRDTRDFDKDTGSWIATTFQGIAAGWLAGIAFGIIVLLLARI